MRLVVVILFLFLFYTSNKIVNFVAFNLIYHYNFNSNVLVCPLFLSSNFQNNVITESRESKNGRISSFALI